ncbi:MAG: type II toxin-antitoxin system HicB family antitoxin [Actinobacteria bacterium]|nr:type II toxin-antitoxin system HicB family antitoxin [Actinomycetota bacterium]MBS1884874.1 type II toxin-antitoxin system HicB family antitoxin [Actinomycetota bacterium]
MKLTAVYEPVEDGWIQAHFVELPGVITAGRSREEARILLRDALREYLASFDSVPADPGTEREELALTLAP